MEVENLACSQPTPVWPNPPSMQDYGKLEMGTNQPLMKQEPLRAPASLSVSKSQERTEALNISGLGFGAYGRRPRAQSNRALKIQLEEMEKKLKLKEEEIQERVDTLYQQKVKELLNTHKVNHISTSTQCSIETADRETQTQEGIIL